MTDHVNRVLLLVLGLTSAAFGVFVLLARSSAVHLDQPSQIFTGARDSFSANANLAVAVTLVICLLLLALSLWSLRAQSGVRRRHRPRPLCISTARGSTRLDASLIEQAVAFELRNQPGIMAARVAVKQTGLDPRFDARVEVLPTIDLASVADAVETACESARVNLAVNSLDGELNIALSSRDIPRVG